MAAVYVPRSANRLNPEKKLAEIKDVHIEYLENRKLFGREKSYEELAYILCRCWGAGNVIDHVSSR